MPVLNALPYTPKSKLKLLDGGTKNIITGTLVSAGKVVELCTCMYCAVVFELCPLSIYKVPAAFLTIKLAA
jgi:hypothetical protein